MIHVFVGRRRHVVRHRLAFVFVLSLEIALNEVRDERGGKDPLLVGCGGDGGGVVVVVVVVCSGQGTRGEGDVLVGGVTVVEQIVAGHGDAVGVSEGVSEWFSRPRVSVGIFHANTPDIESIWILS